MKKPGGTASTRQTFQTRIVQHTELEIRYALPKLGEIGKPSMAGKRYALKAEINTSNPDGIKAVLLDLVGVDGILGTDEGFKVTATMTGESARELNRTLLSALRRVEKNTTLRAEWIHVGTTERFFDYVPKGIRKA